jgi:hypothetical protein
MSSPNFHSAANLFLPDCSTTGEISLAGYLLQHGLTRRDASVGSVGLLPRAEALALNALVLPEATFVVLGNGSLMDGQGYSAELINDYKAYGFDIRTQFADLTLPGRWPQLLTAIARTPVGIVGIDAHVASAQSNFWTTLQQFMQDGEPLVYIRNILDFRSTRALLPLIRTMPVLWDQNVVAATPNSIWFASDAKRAASVRQMLRRSGVFTEDDTTLQIDSADAPVVSHNERSLNFVDGAGRFPLSVYFTNSKFPSAVDYKSGWSRPEPDGCWTEGQEAVIKLRLPDAMVHTPFFVKVSGNSWLAPDQGKQVLEVGIGDEPQEWTEVMFDDPEKVLTITLNCEKMKHDTSELVIHFRVSNPGRPSDYGGQDQRLLGFKCRVISLFT